jgi:hypothetical protein
MSIVHISVQFSDEHTEVLLDDAEQTELIIESLVSTALLELSDLVHVKKVTIITPQTAAVETPERVSKIKL